MIQGTFKKKVEEMFPKQRKQLRLLVGKEMLVNEEETVRYITDQVRSQFEGMTIDRILPFVGAAKPLMFPATDIEINFAKKKLRTNVGSKSMY